MAFHWLIFITGEVLKTKTNYSRMDYIYINTLCKEPQSKLMIDDTFDRYEHCTLDEHTAQEGRWKSVTINDSSIVERLIHELDCVHTEYPKFKYLLLIEHENSSKGQYRVHINRQGRKIVTMKAKRRIRLSF